MFHKLKFSQLLQERQTFDRTQIHEHAYKIPPWTLTWAITSQYHNLCL